MQVDYHITNKITLRDARVLSGFTLKDAAANIGISVSALGRYECDSGKTPCSVAIKLLILYKVSTTDLIHIGAEADINITA